METEARNTVVWKLQAEPGALKGWILDTAAPNDRITFELLVGGASMGTFVADRSRSSLISRFGGDGRHGFSIDVPQAWSSATPRLVQFRLVDGRTFDAERRMVLVSVDDAATLAAVNAEQAEQERDLEKLVDSIRDLQAGDFRVVRAIRERLEKRILRPIARQAFAERRWEDLASLSNLVVPSRDQGMAIQLMVARGLLHENRVEQAVEILASFAAKNGENAQWQFYLGVGLARLERYEAALPVLRTAIGLDPESAQYRRELATVFGRMARQVGNDPDTREHLIEQALAEFAAAAEVASLPAQATEMRLRAAQLLVEVGRFREAIDRLDTVLADGRDDVPVLLAKSRALIGVGEMAEALEIAHAILAREPDNLGALYQARTLKAIAAESAAEGPPRVAILRVDGAGVGVVLLTGAGDPRPVPASVSALCAEACADWLAIGRDEAAAEIVARAEGAPAWSGRVFVPLADGATVDLWRVDLLDGLAESGLLDQVAELRSDLARIEDLVATVDLAHPSPWEPAGPAGPRRTSVICMSRHGIHRFGGGEEFLDSMAEHYAGRGFEPVIVGARPGRTFEEGVEDGRRYAMLDSDMAVLRRYFLQQRPAVVHVLSGLGLEVAHALQYLDIPFIYGVHFWRDCLGATEGTAQFFENDDQGPIPRKSFNLVIERAATIYSNSQYTQAILEKAFSIRTPILYSLPRDTAPPDDPERALALTGGIRDYVLLLNSRADKGFDLIVETALRLPAIHFVVVASQSDRQQAVRFALAAGATNVHVIERTDRPDLLYRHALVTVVPSYKFIETFSRVCIEAQRFGCPVIGSDKGNVPYLLHESGVVLPEDPAAYAAEIGRLHADPAYREERRRAASENSRRYAYDVQAQAHARLVPKIGRRVLIAIGSGIGNMLHVGPMIRNIARRLGHPVDIVVAEDHPESLFLLQDPQYVSEVFSLSRAVLRRRYDLVFVTNSFGNMRPPFSSERILYSRDWRSFDVEGPLHETVYNLEAAQEMLGIPYDPEDVQQFYVGEFRYSPPAAGRLIGFHGGSKERFWTAKRWPGYTELAARLQALGWECASFGTPAEYVEGTTDRTGGTIAEMTDAMRACSYFVTNDSGVMNIANALGIPLTSLFAPTNPGTRAPLRSTSTYLAVGKDCSPCEVTERGRAVFFAGECRCIAELSVDEVEAHVLAHLARLELRPGG